LAANRGTSAAVARPVPVGVDVASTPDANVAPQ